MPNDTPPKPDTSETQEPQKKREPEPAVVWPRDMNTPPDAAPSWGKDPRGAGDAKPR